MKSNTTINELPNDVIKIILRRVIVTFDTEQYFFISKRFTTICNSMAQKYKRNNHFCCLICRDRDYYPAYFKNRSHNLRILFDNICNLCLTTANPKSCNYCKIIFMLPEKHYYRDCINCLDKINKMCLVVGPTYDTQLSYLLSTSDKKCIYCKCKLNEQHFPPYFNDKLTCQKCYDKIKIGDKIIVLPDGFPYEINTYCPKKLNL